MTRIHIVEPYHSTAMQHMTEPWADLGKLYHVTTSEEIDPAADLNIHMPWHTLAKTDGGTSKHIIAYTHCNAGAEAALIDACERADIVTCMSYEGRRELIALGVDPKKLWVVYAAASQYKYRRRLIAIIGFPQPNGRKRESILFDMAWNYDLSMYEFLFVGAGWEQTAGALASLGAAVQAFTADTWEVLNTIYHRIDALLVTGYVEGGPLPLLEAMASGCKVFSPKFGYAADLLGPDDLYSGPDDLMQKMNDYFWPGMSNYYLTRTWTWHDYAAEYAMLAGRLLGDSVDLYPERGASRYAQLLDIVDEVKPQSIVEIGTWKGDTALRLIQQAAKYRPIERIQYQGFDLFEMQTLRDFKAELSKGGWIQDVIQRRLDATGAGVTLVKGYTRDTLFAYGKGDADLYFIDGGHSEETIENDSVVVFSMKPGAVAVFDDYYHEGKPEGMGCNRFILSLDPNKFLVTFLPAITVTDDGRHIGMVRVEKRKVSDADLRLQRWEAYNRDIPDVRAGGQLADNQVYIV